MVAREEVETPALMRSVTVLRCAWNTAALMGRGGAVSERGEAHWARFAKASN